MIHITDGQSDRILDVITKRHIIDNKHRKSLEDTLETFDFRALGDKRYVQYLEKRNRVIIPDEDGSLVEFIIHEAAKYRDTEGLKAAVYASASYLDLKKSRIIYPTSLESYTASTAAGFALNETEWSPGIIEGKGTRTFRVEDHTNPFALLKRIAREFELELNFRVEHNGQRVTGRYVDLLERVGKWQGREVEFGRDLIGIRRTEKTENVVTALLGIGPEREDGTRLEVLVTDDEALQRWGRRHPRTGELMHIIAPYEPQSERENMSLSELRQYTQTELNKRINAVVDYETTIADLEHVPGMENKKIRFGDTIKIKDGYFGPPLYVEARVYQLDRSITDKSKKEIKLGDYIEYTEDEVKAIWKQLQAEVRRKISAEQLREYAEPKKVVSDTPPEQNENVIWVDTSQEPYVPKVYNFGDWQKMTPTEAIEIGAETPKGAQEKADAAEESAKTYAEDAGNIMRGIIDVGAVPLRTSVTGARIEWDGANGLVQYDTKGNPVSWLDLSGNARFENAYLSGEIHAQSGTFAGQLQGASGTFEGTVSGGTILQTGPDGSIRLDNSGLHSLDNSGKKRISISTSNTGFDGFVPSSIYFEPDIEELTFVVGTGMHGLGDGFIGFPEAANWERHLNIRNWGGVISLTADYTNIVIDPTLNASRTGLQFSGRSVINPDDYHAISIYEGDFVFYGNRRTGRPFRVRSHDRRSGFRDDFYISTSGIPYVPNVWNNESTNPNNVRVDSNGQLLRGTSSRRYKILAEPITNDPFKILGLSPKTWYDKNNTEAYAEYLTLIDHGEDVSADDSGVDPIKRIPGLVAEDVETVGLEEFVEYGENGIVEGVMYDRLWTLLIPIVREQQKRIEALEGAMNIET